MHTSKDVLPNWNEGLATSRRILSEVLQRIRKELLEDPLRIHRSGSYEHELVVHPTYFEIVRPLLLHMTSAREPQVLLSPGLTRVGKTRAATLLRSTLGKACQYLSLEVSNATNALQITQHALADNPHSPHGVALVIFDEWGATRNGALDHPVRMTPEHSLRIQVELIETVQQQFPNALIWTIDTWGRNRGEIGQEISQHPDTVYEPLIAQLAEHNTLSEMHYVRDAWSLQSTETYLRAVSHVDAREHAIVGGVARELQALTLGNPSLITEVLWHIRNETSDGLVLDMNALHAKLLAANTKLLTTIYNTLNGFTTPRLSLEYDKLGFGNNLGQVFRMAFGGNNLDIFLIKLLKVSLQTSSANTGSVDFSLWGGDYQTDLA